MATTYVPGYHVRCGCGWAGFRRICDLDTGPTQATERPCPRCDASVVPVRVGARRAA